MSIEIQEQIPLAPFTTLKIGGPAKFFCTVKNTEDVLEAVDFAQKKGVPHFVLGGGSNIVVSDKGFAGLVLHPVMAGIQIVNETSEAVDFNVGAGESWDTFVALAVEKKLWGIENLSHIPGSVGASAVQNIGAYGQEAKDTLLQVHAVSLKNREEVILENQRCQFGYRKSIFNTSHRDKFVISSITFRLKKNGKPNLGYRDLANRFAPRTPTLPELRQAVIEIRNKKFPFPKIAVNGNVGSFFKNPVVDSRELNILKIRLADSFGEEVAEKLSGKVFQQGQEYKIPAAFLLEICGLKNYQIGGAAINDTQPLVILNKTGHATAQDVWHLSNYVRNMVQQQTDVELEIEPEFVGF